MKTPRLDALLAEVAFYANRHNVTARDALDAVEENDAARDNVYSSATLAAARRQLPPGHKSGKGHPLDKIAPGVRVFVITKGSDAAPLGYVLTSDRRFAYNLGKLATGAARPSVTQVRNKGAIAALRGALPRIEREFHNGRGDYGAAYYWD